MAEHPESIGPYQVVDRLDPGGALPVYEAVKSGDTDGVAIKLLAAEIAADPAKLERFEADLAAVSALDHPNVVAVLDHGVADDRPYVVEELVRGTSLAAILRDRRMTLPEAVKVFKGMTRALVVAHRRDLVHRQLSPSKVLLSDDLATVKVTGFGLSRLDSAVLPQGTISTSQLSVGSLHYMAPEQARDLGSVDRRSDIYSAGVMLYQMLTGRLPVGRFSLPSQLTGDVPPEIDPVVLKCLASNPADRYESADQLLAEIERLEHKLRLAVVDELRGISRSVTRSTRTVAKSRTGRVALLAAGVVALAVIAAALYLQGVGGDVALPAPDIGSAGAPAAAPAGEPLPATVPADDDTSGAPGEEGVLPEDAPGEPPATTADGAPAAPEGAAGSAAPAAAAAPPVRERPAARPAAPAPTPAPAPAVDPALSELKVARDQMSAQLWGPAIETLRGVIDHYPDSPSLVDAYFLVADAQSASGHFQDALATFVEIRSRFPRAKRAPEAAYRLAELIVASGDRSRLNVARETFRDLAAEHPDSSWAPRALAAEADLEAAAKMRQTDPELKTTVPLSLVTWRTLVQRYPKAAEAEKAYWELGEAYDDLKRFDLAAAAFAELGTRFPDTRYDAWWRAGQLFDRRLDQNDKAVEAYRKVPQSSPHYGDAQKRINRLTR